MTEKVIVGLLIVRNPPSAKSPGVTVLLNVPLEPTTDASCPVMKSVKLSLRPLVPPEAISGLASLLVELEEEDAERAELEEEKPACDPWLRDALIELTFLFPAVCDDVVAVAGAVLFETGGGFAALSERVNS